MPIHVYGLFMFHIKKLPTSLPRSQALPPCALHMASIPRSSTRTLVHRRVYVNAVIVNLCHARVKEYQSITD